MFFRHTYANYLTGLIIFTLSYTLKRYFCSTVTMQNLYKVNSKYSCTLPALWIVCCITLIGASGCALFKGFGHKLTNPAPSKTTSPAGQQPARNGQRPADSSRPRTAGDTSAPGRNRLDTTGTRD